MKEKKQIGVIFKIEDYEIIREHAFKAKKNISAFVRELILKKIKSKDCND